MILGATVLSLSLTTCSKVITNEASSPNFLIILADDLSWCDAGCYGNLDVKTPHIDELAKQGLKFNFAFTSTAMCSPSRQQLYTGLYPVRNGAIQNHSYVKTGTKSMVHHLKNIGYRVGLHGGGHFGPTESFPFQSVKNVRKYIYKRTRKPFCLVYSSEFPHLPWPDPMGYFTEGISVPVHLVDNQETRKAICSYYTGVSKFDAEVGQLLKILKQCDKEDNTVVFVTSEQGAAFPGGKWTCYDYGLRTQMIVRWPGKIAGGTESDAMIQYVDLVPTLVELAGGFPDLILTGIPNGGGKERGFDGKSFADVLFGKRDYHNKYVYGIQTSNGIKSGGPYPVRSIRNKQFKYIMNLMPDSTFKNNITQNDPGHFWMSWKRDSTGDSTATKLINRYQHRPLEEFYDLVNDPFELTNLAGNSTYKSQMETMKLKLLSWMKDQGDSGIKTELFPHLK